MSNVDRSTLKFKIQGSDLNQRCVIGYVVKGIKISTKYHRDSRDSRLRLPGSNWFALNQVAVRVKVILECQL